MPALSWQVQPRDSWNRRPGGDRLQLVISVSRPSTDIQRQRLTSQSAHAFLGLPTSKMEPLIGSVSPSAIAQTLPNTCSSPEIWCLRERGQRQARVSSLASALKPCFVLPHQASCSCHCFSGLPLPLFPKSFVLGSDHGHQERYRAVESQRLEIGEASRSSSFFCPSSAES